jgi:hypothetical protein
MSALQQEIIDVEEQEEKEEDTEKADERAEEREKVVGELEDAVEEMGTVTFEIPSVLLHNLPLIALVVGTGVGLIVLRWVVMISCPEIASHAKTYAFIIDFLFGAVRSFMDLITIKNVVNVVGFAVDTEGGVGSAVDLAIETATVALPYALGIAHWTNLFSKTTWDMFSTTDVQTFFSRLPGECEAFDDIEHVFLFPVRAIASPTVCPLIRFTWPVPWMYSASTTTLGWMSFDSDPMGNNCVPQDTDPYAWVCVGLGMGYVVIDIVLPMLLFMLFGYRCVPARCCVSCQRGRPLTRAGAVLQVYFSAPANGNSAGAAHRVRDREPAADGGRGHRGRRVGHKGDCHRGGSGRSTVDGLVYIDQITSHYIPRHSTAGHAGRRGSGGGGGL